MRVTSYIVTLLFIIFSCAAFAAEPFGLKIGEAKFDDVAITHSGEIVGHNQWTDGKTYNLSVPDLNFEGLISANAIFDTNDTLVGLLLEFQKDRFESLHEMTENNYPKQRSRIPYVGDKEAIYRDGDVSIELYSPHMSFQMQMYYLHDSFIEAYEAGSSEAAKAKVDKESRALFGN